MQSSQRSPIIFLGASSSPLSLPNKAIPISLPQIGQTVIFGLTPCFFTKYNIFTHNFK